jgi:hypothetical protein
MWEGKEKHTTEKKERAWKNMSDLDSLLFIEIIRLKANKIKGFMSNRK